MKVICDRSALLEALALASGVIVSRTPKPVLACVKLTAAEGVLTVAATDLEVALRLHTSKVEVQEPGEALIPADKLNQIVRESVDATLSIEVTDQVAEIRGQDSRFKIYGFPSADAPAIPTFEGEADFQISSAEFHRLVSQTIFATARENTRYAINGVLLEREGNKIAIVATDGHRLALSKGSCKASKADNRSAIVPTKALHMLLRLFGDTEQPVKVKIADNQILFSSEETLLASNLVEGNFPPYKDVIPKDCDKKATLDTHAIQSAVRRASLLTNDESKGVRLNFSDEGLTLTSRAPEMGEAEVKVPVPSYVGEPVEIGFNPQFILDALKVVQSDQVTLEFKAANKPGILRTGPDFLYVIMPVNLQ